MRELGKQVREQALIDARSRSDAALTKAQLRALDNVFVDSVGVVRVDVAFCRPQVRDALEQRGLVRRSRWDLSAEGLQVIKARNVTPRTNIYDHSDLSWLGDGTYMDSRREEAVPTGGAPADLAATIDKATDRALYIGDLKEELADAVVKGDYQRSGEIATQLERLGAVPSELCRHGIDAARPGRCSICYVLAPSSEPHALTWAGTKYLVLGTVGYQHGSWSAR